ncbi:hypothetical protein H5410_061439 [Solanum commersonii]|uniref:Uncharacterized protein n=1 Tax=Solanum commersonii TaxID=4109 RepID=A0A9J5W826_SOLCO|nr:hypothetical protein H5410_061439 [Solanum commersonii]
MQRDTHFKEDVPIISSLTNVQTMLNKVTQNDDGGKVDAPDDCLSIFLHPGRPNGKMNGHYLSGKE